MSTNNESAKRLEQLIELYRDDVVYKEVDPESRFYTVQGKKDLYIHIKSTNSRTKGCIFSTPNFREAAFFSELELSLAFAYAAFWVYSDTHCTPVKVIRIYPPPGY